MSAFIPDQLDQMSKKELLEFARTAHEFARTAHEENVKLKAEKKKILLTTVADYVLEAMRSENIENFSTNAFSTGDGRRVELTIRYVDGDTPADKLHRQQDEITKLTEKLAKANERARSKRMAKQQIKDLALANGFKLKEQVSGEMDLNPYVYDFANALLATINERIGQLRKRQE